MSATELSKDELEALQRLAAPGSTLDDDEQSLVEKVLDTGIGSLTPQEQVVFQDFYGRVFNAICPVHGDVIPASDLGYPHTHGLCLKCANDKFKS